MLRKGKNGVKKMLSVAYHGYGDITVGVSGALARRRAGISCELRAGQADTLAG